MTVYPYQPTGDDTLQLPNREFFVSPYYEDREQREHVRRLVKWPDAGPIDNRTILALEAYPRLTGKSDALASWLCRTLASPEPHHLIMPIMQMVPVVVTLTTHGHLMWPQISETKRKGMDVHVERWLGHGQAFVIVVGFDGLLPEARATARFEINFAMERNPKCRWFVNAEHFAPAKKVEDVDLVHTINGPLFRHPPLVPPPPAPGSEQAFVAALKQMREDVLRTIAHLVGVDDWDSFEITEIAGRTALLTFPLIEDERRIDLQDVDFDGNPLEALEAVENLLGYYDN